MIFSREEARDEIKRRWKELYPAAKDGKGIICPLCGHGTNGDGIVVNKGSSDPQGLKCFSCGFSGDVLSLIEQDMSMDYNRALQYAADQLNIQIDPAGSAQKPQDKPEAQEVQDIPKAQKPAQEPEEANYIEYYKECRDRLNDPRAVSYLSERGISLETAAAYMIGFDPEADPANAPGKAVAGKSHPAPRIIMPTNAGHYVGRAIRSEERYMKLNAKGSEPGIFNERALYNSDIDAVFVTEGIFDALSIIEAGAAAIALCSTSNTGKFLERLEKKPTKATLILCFDQDDAGRKYTQPLREGLDRLNISYITGDICGNAKDPNDALVQDRDAFIDSVKRELGATSKPDNTALYIYRFMQDDIARFTAAGERKTGFYNLDKESGGLYSGLYIIAATSSLGKTTFALQIADQLAGAGHDVIFFSLEQSRLELVSKSIARITALEDPTRTVPSLAVRGGYGDREAAARAIQKYKDTVGDRMSIVEGNFNCDLSFIGDYIGRYIDRNGQEHRPIIIVDYLQILTPEKDDRGRMPSTKEAIDSAVTGLKRLSREKDLTIIAISSVNRANYMQPIDFESLKESGGIEYSADVVWGMQLQCLNEDLFSSEKKIKEKRGRIKQAKAESPRKIELVCLKNRYGISSFSCNFDYYPDEDLFISEAYRKK